MLDILHCATCFNISLHWKSSFTSRKIFLAKWFVFARAAAKSLILSSIAIICKKKSPNLKNPSYKLKTNSVTQLWPEQPSFTLTLSCSGQLRSTWLSAVRKELNMIHSTSSVFFINIFLANQLAADSRSVLDLAKKNTLFFRAETKFEFCVFRTAQRRSAVPDSD